MHWIIILALLSVCYARSIHEDAEIENVMDGVDETTGPGCDASGTHWKLGQTRTQGGVTCICQPGNQWTCKGTQAVTPPPKFVKCSYGKRIYSQGETMTDTGVSCTCHDGKWECEHETTNIPINPNSGTITPSAEILCKMESRQFREGEVVQEAGSVCVCQKGEWTCSTSFIKGKKICKLGNTVYNDGETYVEGLTNCVCRSGRWYCPKKNGPTQENPHHRTQ